MVMVLSHVYDDRHGFVGMFDIFRCKYCGSAATLPKLPRNKMNKIYQKFYPTTKIDVSSVKKSRWTKPRDEVIQRNGTWINCHYHARGGESVLDVGCGVGFSLLELQNMGCHPYGIDPNQQASKLARKYKIPFHIGYLEDKPFKGVKFDVICASQVLEHTEDPAEFLKVCKKRLRPGGRIILSFPNIDAWSRVLLQRKWLHWHVPYHYYFLSAKGIKTIVSKCNLRILSLETYTPNLWTVLQIRHLFAKHKVGARDTLWDGRAIAQSKNNLPRLIILIRKFFDATMAMCVSFNPLNRIIDYLRGGESWVIVLTE